MVMHSITSFICANDTTCIKMDDIKMIRVVKTGLESVNADNMLHYLIVIMLHDKRVYRVLSTSNKDKCLKRAYMISQYIFGKCTSACLKIITDMDQS